MKKMWAQIAWWVNLYAIYQIIYSNNISQENTLQGRLRVYIIKIVIYFKNWFLWFFPAVEDIMTLMVD